MVLQRTLAVSKVLSLTVREPRKSTGVVIGKGMGGAGRR